MLGETLITELSMMREKKRDDLVPIFISVEDEEKSCIVPKLESYKNGWNIDFR